MSASLPVEPAPLLVEPEAAPKGRTRSYGVYLLKRLAQFAVVVFIGMNITYAITHATPIDPVEQTITAATSFGSTSPEAIATMREALRELYGTGGNPIQQYLGFWRRVAAGDFG